MSNLDEPKHHVLTSARIGNLRRRTLSTGRTWLYRVTSIEELTLNAGRRLDLVHARSGNTFAIFRADEWEALKR